MDQSAHRIKAPQMSDEGGHQLSSCHQQGIFLPGAREDGPVDCSGATAQVGAGEEGAHGVAQQEIGYPGKPLAHLLTEGVHVLGHQAPAVVAGKIAKLSRRLPGLAVAQMVLAAHHIAVGIEVAGEVVIPPHVLGNAVDDLHHAPYLALGLPQVSGTWMFPVRGGKPNHFWLLHGVTLPSPPLGVG